ncbi:TPA: hypothetical protein SMV80_005203 [Pseudomonas aeruginosa]|uniref:hypothetical protein n=1 Tax=Pseudomonas aeruginosa TaxID=287 RepID=UPI001A1B61BD|nr:hypothetical protein [Pseudomonas aeruginosa]HCF3570124.1 hypothetical protein [Pseudomonas aeruginosa]HEJ2711935.1 hypothetical protein [Pseudomonas aeruginosa]HEJ2775971.1 hypothetical protein [Pseudomonas aeruginosa]HEJ3182324.1 hypothetical protein [Pseudomonas aeruginosa]
MSERYRVEQTGKGFWPYCVRAGNGTRDLYVGHKKTCDRVAAELTTAFRDGEFVGKGLYDALAAEAQALREEVARLLEDRARFPDKPDDIGRMIGAHIENLKHVADESRRMCLKAMRERDVVEQDLEALRARVVVTPDASTVYAVLDARERLFTSPENIQVALEAQSRLNGKTVSEGLLREVARHLGNWLELHECECDGGFHYCGRDQVAKTNRELRALLNQDKENGNG